jgi:hypothetical protein
MTPCEIIPLWGRDHLGIRGRHHSVTRGGIIQELGGGFLRNQHVLANCPKANAHSINDRCKVRYAKTAAFERR